MGCEGGKQSGMNHRIEWIDNAKGIGIVLVVLGHVIVGMRGSGLIDNAHWAMDIKYILYSFHMPLFFFLAGLNVENSYRAKGAVGFIKTKLLTIAYPYLLWSFITGSIQILGKKYVNSDLAYIDLLSIIWRPLPDQHYWFLYVLLMMFAVYLLVEKIINKKSVLLYLFLGILFYFIPIHSGVRVIDKFDMNMIYLGLGILYAKHVGVGSVKYKSKKAVGGGLILLFFGFIFLLNVGNTNRLCGLMIALTGGGVVVFGSMLLDHKPLGTYIQQIGKASLPIYLAHAISGSGIRIILQKGLGLESAALHLIAGVILGTAIPFLLYKSANYMNVPYLFTLKSRS